MGRAMNVAHKVAVTGLAVSAVYGAYVSVGILLSVRKRRKEWEAENPDFLVTHKDEIARVDAQLAAVKAGKKAKDVVNAGAGGRIRSEVEGAKETIRALRDLRNVAVSGQTPQSSSSPTSSSSS